MKKIVIMLLAFSLFTTPSYALNIIDRLRYQEVRLGDERVLVNRITGKVERRWVNNAYEPISAEKGFKGIISDQEMFQAQYEKLKR